MKNYISAGDVIEYTPSGADVASGDVVVIGTIAGVAVNDIKDGQSGPVKLTGVYALPKAGSQAWTVGAAVYWDAANKQCTTDPEDNVLLGIAVEAVGNSATETVGKVRLNGVGGLGTAVDPATA